MIQNCVLVDPNLHKCPLIVTTVTKLRFSSVSRKSHYFAFYIIKRTIDVLGSQDFRRMIPKFKTQRIVRRFKSLAEKFIKSENLIGHKLYGVKQEDKQLAQSAWNRKPGKLKVTRFLIDS